MTTVKICFKVTLLCMLALLLVLGSVGCKNDGESAFEQLQALLKNEDETVKLYRIILPTDAGSELAERAAVLAQGIEAKTGVECERYYDNQKLHESEDTVYICLGNTSLYENAQIRTLHRDDYIYRVSGEYILLGGKSDSATMAAIEYFEQNVLPYCESEDITEHEGDFEYFHAYELSQFKLCGFDFRDFYFVCTSPRTAEEAGHMLKLRELIADKCGAYPEALFEQQSADGRHELVVSLRADKANTASISYDGEDVVLCAGDAYGISVLADKLYKLFTSSVLDGKSSVNISNDISHSYIPNKISVASVMTSFSNDLNIPQSSPRLLSKINSLNEDVLFLGMMNKDLCGSLEQELSQDFEFKAFEVDQSTSAVFACRKSKISQAVLSAQVYDGGVALMLDVKHVSDESTVRLCAVVEHDAAKRDESIKTLKNSFEQYEGRMLALLECADNCVLDISAKGFAVYHNSSVVLGADIHNVSVLASTENTDCSIGELVEDNDIATLHLTLGKSCCDDFSRL